MNVAAGEDLKSQLRLQLQQARERTLWLFDQVPDELLRNRVHEFYSPIGWHFGHIGRTEEYWCVCEATGKAPLENEYTFLFADIPENPKENRVNLPSRDQIREYLGRTRELAMESLEAADLEDKNSLTSEGYAWFFAAEHELQHQETIAELMQLLHQAGSPGSSQSVQVPWQSSGQTEWILHDGGTFQMGTDNRLFYDNEQDSHPITVESFELAEYPVTALEWTEFINDGGYLRCELWSEEGWRWRTEHQIELPEYWFEEDGEYRIYSPLGSRVVHPDEPANCLSWYEADAYARWAGARLPTEAEFEFAATIDTDGTKRLYGATETPPEAEDCVFWLRRWYPQPVRTSAGSPTVRGVKHLYGNVWEWTSSKFSPYPGFKPFPYPGYSADHMKGAHYVCRGGSFATSAPILRGTFRNWYVPTYRQGFLGVRLAR
jgi:iron(II)-dependent oxidoreductase